MRIMVVSREMASLRPLWSVIELNSWQLETVTTGWEALERIQSGVCPQLLIVDSARGDTDCLHIVRWLRRLRPQLPILLLFQPEDAAQKSDAMRMGADAVLVKPFSEHELEFAIYRHLPGSRPESDHVLGSDHAEPLGEEGCFVSASSLMRKVVSQAELLAEVDVPVFILGEPGSGKQELAHLIHRLSVRSGFKFLIVNCTAMPGDVLEKEIFGVEETGHNEKSTPGKIEVAAKGTVLIAEVTAMPAQVQAVLLNVICNGSYTRVGGGRRIASHARLLITSSTNMEHALADRSMREDLYHRASAFTLHVPPLRQRKDEIPILIAHFMHKLAKHFGLPRREVPAGLIEKCQNYSWPGNLDELETFVKRYIVSGDSALALNQVRGSYDSNSKGMRNSPEQLDDSIETEQTSSTSLKTLIQSLKSETERTAIGLALEKTHWNRKAAARLLSVSYRTLLYKIEQYQMSSGRPLSSVRATDSHFVESGTKAPANRLPSGKH